MAKRPTAEELAEEARKARRNAARAERRARKKAEAGLAAGEEAEPVSPVALGVPKEKVAAATSPKKVTEARANLSEAFDLMGGVPALVAWGRKNPTEFYRIWARLIPKEVAEEATRLPLEDLLGKLAARAEQSVGEAAAAIGQELLDKGREGATLEDQLAALTTGQTIQ